MKGYQFYNGKLNGNIISDYENMDLWHQLDFDWEETMIVVQQQQWK